MRVKVSCGAPPFTLLTPPSPPSPPRRTRSVKTKRNYEGLSYTGCQTVGGYNAWCYTDPTSCPPGVPTQSTSWDYCTDTLSQWCPAGWSYNSFSTYGDGG